MTIIGETHSLNRSAETWTATRFAPCLGLNGIDRSSTADGGSKMTATGSDRSSNFFSVPCHYARCRFPSIAVFFFGPHRRSRTVRLNFPGFSVLILRSIHKEFTEFPLNLLLFTVYVTKTILQLRYMGSSRIFSALNGFAESSPASSLAICTGQSACGHCISLGNFSVTTAMGAVRD